MTYLLLRVAIILGLVAFFYILWVSKTQNNPPLGTSEKKKRMWEEANEISEKRKKREERKMLHLAHVDALREQAHDGSLVLTDGEIAHLSRKYK
jgi:hypothetical protein